MKRQVRISWAGEEDFVLFVGHRRLKWTLCLWPIVAAVILGGVVSQPSRVLIFGTLIVLAILTAYWLREHFGSDALFIHGGEISLTRGFGTVKTTATFRISDIESVAFYPASRNPQAEPESCLGILARQWVLPLTFAPGIEEEEATETLRQMKVVVSLAARVHLQDLAGGTSERKG